MRSDDLDKALHDCMNVIWRAYRDSVASGNFEPFNSCFSGLYEKYGDDVAVQKFIGGMGLALVPAANRQIRKDSGNG